MKHVLTLIDKARELVHSDRELAHRLHITAPELARVKKGKRPPSPELVATLCDMLELSGEECRELVAYSIIENPKNRDRAGLLRRAFFVCWALGVGFLSSTQDAKAMTPAYRIGVNDLYIVAHWLRMMKRRMQSFGATLRTTEPGLSL